MRDAGMSDSRISRLCGSSSRSSESYGKDEEGDDDDWDQSESDLGNDRQPGRGRGGAAQACYTQFGACPMMMPVPPGASCHCRTPYGPVPGQAG
jgi:hypothetical protein